MAGVEGLSFLKRRRTIMHNLFVDTRKIYSALSDEISRRIFIARFNCSATGDVRFIEDIPMEYRNISADIQMFANKLYEKSPNHLVVFGAGANGRDLVSSLKKVPFLCFIDNKKQMERETRTGLPVYSLDEYREKYDIDNTKFVISVSNKIFIKQIVEQLKGVGVLDNHIISIADWRNNTSQYFDVFTARENESFVDCGCYDGSTAFRFAGWCAENGVSYDRIWSFEPDKNSFVKCKNILSTLANCDLYPYGISNKEGTVSFFANGHENARIIKGEAGEDSRIESIEVIKLDEFLKDERVTFIKMDIEGAEYDALQGAAQIIKDQKPRLAISVYHKPDDIINIPKLLLSLRADYRFYLRHYSLLANEIVLYAE